MADATSVWGVCFDNLRVLLLGLGHGAQFWFKTRHLEAVLEREENESIILEEKGKSTRNQPEDPQEVLQIKLPQ